MNNPPYDTGKVKIGLTYTPPPPECTPESDWIQGSAWRQAGDG
jgi:hypothetical protein